MIRYGIATAPSTPSSTATPKSRRVLGRDAEAGKRVVRLAVDVEKPVASTAAAQRNVAVAVVDVAVVCCAVFVVVIWLLPLISLVVLSSLLLCCYVLSFESEGDGNYLRMESDTSSEFFFLCVCCL